MKTIFIERNAIILNFTFPCDGHFLAQNAIEKKLDWIKDWGTGTVYILLYRAVKNNVVPYCTVLVRRIAQYRAVPLLHPPPFFYCILFFDGEPA